MTPTPHRQAVIVGAFTTVAVAILVGGILTVGDLNDTFTHKVDVSAVFEEVNGLQRGDNVWFSGVKIGVVQALRFHGEAQVEVQMRVDEDATQYIHKDALARVGSDGLIGSRIVILYGGTSESPAVVDGDVLAVGEALSTDEIMKVFQENNENVRAITTDLRGITASLAKGEGTLGLLLEDEAAAAELSETLTALNQTADNARQLSASLETFSAKLNKEGGLPDDLVSDRTSYASLTRTVGQLEQAGARASTLVDGLATSAADPDTPFGTLMHDDAAGADLKRTLDQLDRGTLLLSEDLEALQHNFLLRGYFKRKARQEKKAAAEEARTKAQGEP